MAKFRFETSAMKDIVDRRRQKDGSITRELECGHFVPQPAGGKASTATKARCEACEAQTTKRTEPAPAEPSMLLTVGLA